ncbi:MAG: hypothetical protein WBF13_07790 [Candidatus Zixiibacteriota bacterium]
MKKKEGWCFGRLLILAIATALVASVALTAYTTGEQKPEITNLTLTDPGTGHVRSWAGTDSKGVVWDNGMQYDNGWHSQDDPPSGLDPIPADDFMFQVDQLVNDVHWLGAYAAGPPDDGDFDWRVIFYNDFGDGTKPGAVIATWVFPNAQVNETFVEEFMPGVFIYSYSVDLPAALSFLAGTKYWISIQGVGAAPPYSYWAMHSDQILLHEAVFKSIYYGYPDWTNSSVVLGTAHDMCFQLTFEERCDWQPGDPHKMHYPQLPDEDGWDVNATQPLVLADDWECSEEGWVKDIHFWGSWKHGIEGTIVGFWLSIHSNIPDPDGPGPGYSMPGQTLWELYVEDFDFTPIDPPTMEGWYDPSTGEVFPDDHQAYFQYNICLQEPDWFYQYQDTIYWLNISAIVLEYPDAVWGWKSSENHFMDDAVWAYWGELDWVEIYEPGTSPGPVINQFFIEFGPDGMPIMAGGTDYYDDGTSFNGWYYYWMTNWWNIWFYNAPFDFERYKDVFVHFVWFPTDAQYWIEVALNWATPDWPPGGPPPLPDDQPEEIFIWREYIPLMEPGMPVDFWYTIDQYNPEWVSMDVIGANVVIPEGIIEHQCLPAEDTVSLDLAFVITGGPPCEPSIDAEKKVWDEENQDWVDLVDLDVGETAQFQIAIHNDGTCCDLTNIDVYDFMDESLEFLSADPPPDAVTPVPGGTELTWLFPGPLSPCNWIYIEVLAEVLGPVCHTDSNYIFVNGACEPQAIEVYDEDAAYVHATEPPWPDHKMHYPQLPDPEGWDIVATQGYDTHPGIVAADDFMCMESGPITDIHFWGSWLWDEEIPIRGFWLSIHDNIPGPPWSMPGAELWSAYVTDFDVTPEGMGPQGWYDPHADWWEHPNHQMYYRYDIDSIPVPFVQDSGTIYWLNVMADLGPPGYLGFPEPYLWGWKTSGSPHFEDDAVWAVWTPPVYDWIPLTNPITGMTLDLSFVITTSEIPVICGDVNNDGIVNVGDIVYLVSYLYKGGPAPIPMECVGDVNNDDVVNVGDVVYLVSYLYRGGPVPDPNCCNPPWKE